MDEEERAASCPFCSQAITTDQATTTAPTLGVDVHTACYQTEFGPKEPTRFRPVG